MKPQAKAIFKGTLSTARTPGGGLARMALASFCLAIGMSFPAASQPHFQKAQQKEKSMNHQANGTFDVKVTPVTADDKSQEADISRWLLDKQFHGDLEAVSIGQMLASGSPADGSGGYVAVEKVNGALNGRKGSFMLQHNGTMKGGAAEMNVVVVPGSGSDQLAGIDGKMTIIIEGGKHSYKFEYTLPNAR